MKITKNNLVSEGRAKERREKERGKRSARSKLGVVAKKSREIFKKNTFKKQGNIQIKGKNTHLKNKQTNPSLLLEVEISSLVVTFK